MTVVLNNNFFGEMVTGRENISPALVKWMSDCPDVAMLQEAFQDYMWKNAKKNCYECGETYTNKDLRYDEASPCGDPSKLICRNCWDCWGNGSLGNPTYRPPPWPAKIDRRVVASSLVNGTIFDKTTKMIVGRVEGYNPRGHFARKVILNGMEDCAEGGSLDPDCVVVADDDSYVVDDDDESDESEEEE